MTAPFVLVRTRSGKKTHLALLTPLVPWHFPEMDPAHTLCARDAMPVEPDRRHDIADVECLTCLLSRAPQVMYWPGFELTS